jgi:hypothetical protein
MIKSCMMENVFPNLVPRCLPKIQQRVTVYLVLIPVLNVLEIFKLNAQHVNQDLCYKLMGISPSVCTTVPEAFSLI